MKTLLLLLNLLALLALPGPLILCAQEPRRAVSPPPVSHASAEFLTETARKNLAGMMLGFLAIQKSETEGVRVYARVVIDDSVKLNKELMELARRMKVEIPLDPLLLPNGNLLSALEKKPAAEFDKAFVVAVLQEGERTRAAWREFFAAAEEGDVKDFASQALADLSQRLSSARELGREIGLAAAQLNPTPVGEGPARQRPSAEPLRSPAPAM